MTVTARPPDGSAPPGEYVGEEMTLFEHLDELRSRLFKSALAVALGFVVGFVVRNPVFDLLIRPYCDLPAELRAGSTAFDPDGCTLVFTDVFGAFFISLKAAAVVAVVLAAPIVSYQIWRFVTPGLRPVERRYALPFLVVSQMLFIGGALFSYFVIPRALELLLGFAGENIVSLMDASRYLSFMIRAMLGFGIAFEFPLILIMLALMGVVTTAGLRRHRRVAIFGICVGAALLTPPDPLSLVLMAAPLVVFYEISILVTRMVERRRGHAAAAA